MFYNAIPSWSGWQQLRRRRYKLLLLSKSRRSVRFRKYTLLILLLALTCYIYYALSLGGLNYLSTPIVIATEDVTGVSHLPLQVQRRLLNSDFTLPDKNKFIRLGHQEFDPRLMPALTMAKITRMIEAGEFDPESFKLPFSWNDWLDLDSKLKANDKWYKLFRNKDFTCSSFKEYYQIDHEFNVCKSLDKQDIERGFPKFKITSFDDKSFHQEARAIMGASYLKYTAPPPDRVIFLGAGPQNGALIMPVAKDPITGVPISASRNQSIVESLAYINHESIIQSTKLRLIISNGISISDQADFLKRAISQSSIDFHTDQDDFQLLEDVVRISNSHDEEGKSFFLHNTEFLFDPHLELQNLESSVAGIDNNYLNLNYTMYKSIKQLLPAAPHYDKHFHESAIIGRPVAGAHYDWRFFNRLDIPYYEHVAILHRTIRAWLRFSRKVGITTWIAHGTMLSWYWNGLNMPWDTDADVQVTAISLYKLARNYNRSLIADITRESTSEIGVGSTRGIGKFFIDVGPSFFSRERGNGNNVIDARFIDTYSGLYIDITGLAFTDFYKNDQLVDKKYQEFLRVLDPDFLQKIDDSKLDHDKYDQELLAKKKLAFDNKEIFNCRNNHHYSLDELSPLIPTLYEGVKLYVPHGYTRILQREYEKGLTVKEFWGHKYMPSLRLWIKKEVCANDLKGDVCDDAVTLAEFKQTQQFTALHKDEMEVLDKGTFVEYSELDEFPPLRIDPWFIRYIKNTLGYLSSSVDYGNAA